MEHYIKQVEVRWSDLDPNFHLRHSVYYDWGAFTRMCFLTDVGLTPQVMMQHHFGPIIFREECVFKKEILFGDVITLNLQLVKSKKDASRWTMQHQVFKNGDIVSAIITVDGAWIDTKLRKLAVPPEMFNSQFQLIPKAVDFTWLDI